MLTLLKPLEDYPMATAKTKTNETAPEADTPKFTLGRFSFAVERGVAIPVAPSKTSPANQLPFPQWFSVMAHNDHFFVPQSYWTAPKVEGGREADPAAVNKPGYARAKIRGSFNAWRKADNDKRGHLDITMANRKAGDEDGKFPEDGVSVWLLDDKAKPAA